MKQYLGTKRLLARPMTRGEYNSYRNWPAPKDEDQNVNGYLVEYNDGGESNHPAHKGYVSWSPQDVFEKSYRPTSGMNFGLALEALKQGHCIARAGWNGKGMFIFLNKGAHHFPESEIPITEQTCYERLPFIEGIQSTLFDNYTQGVSTRLPNLNMRAATGSTVTGWLASQTDILAEDWVDLDAAVPAPTEAPPAA